MEEIVLAIRDLTEEVKKLRKAIEDKDIYKYQDFSTSGVIQHKDSTAHIS